MRSKLLASAVVASALAGGAAFGVSGQGFAVAGAQTGDDRPPAEAGRPGGPGGHRPKLDAAAEALNLSVDDLRSQLRDGKTLAQVAQEQNVDVQVVIDAMVAEATERIDQAVQEGELTAEEANERKANLEERITRLANDGPPPGGPPHGGPRGRGPGLDAAAQALNLSVDDLRSQLRDGKTLAQVAQQQNVDVQSVIDAMVDDARERITRLVNEGAPGPGEDPPQDSEE